MELEEIKHLCSIRTELATSILNDDIFKAMNCICRNCKYIDITGIVPICFRPNQCSIIKDIDNHGCLNYIIKEDVYKENVRQISNNTLLSQISWALIRRNYNCIDSFNNWLKNWKYKKYEI